MAPGGRRVSALPRLQSAGSPPSAAAGLRVAAVPKPGPSGAPAKPGRLKPRELGADSPASRSPQASRGQGRRASAPAVNTAGAWPLEGEEPSRGDGAREREALLEGPDDSTRAIKNAFMQWDVDGSGTISKEELAQVMRQICPMTDEEIDMLMNEADSNGDGVISYEEFVDWLTKPAKQSYGRAILDYSELLQPLFKVYDRTGCGAIGLEDFEECHGILQSSLHLHPQDGASRGALRLDVDAKEAFKQLDISQDGVISYTEFVSWMRDHLDTEGMSGEELKRFTQKLAQILTGIFHLNKMAAEATGALGSEEEAVLGRLVENLAKATCEFERAVGVSPKGPPDQAAPSTWTPPPVGLSIQRLLGQHMKLNPMSARNVDRVDCDVLCVPMPEGASEPDKRIWVAEVVRTVFFVDGKRTVKAPQHYFYNRESFRWAPLPSSKEYETALERLPPELTIFCILKTQADFGSHLDWAGLNRSLQCAVDMDLLTNEDRGTYIRYVESEVLHLLKEEGPDASAHCRDALARGFKMRPTEVMALLTSLGMAQVSPLWKSLVGAEEEEEEEKPRRRARV